MTKENLFELIYQWEEQNINAEELYQKILILFGVSVSLPSDDEIREAADEWVFDKNGMKWSNNDDTAGDNFGSFIAGAKWVANRLSNER